MLSRFTLQDESGFSESQGDQISESRQKIVTEMVIIGNSRSCPRDRMVPCITFCLHRLRLFCSAAEPLSYVFIPDDNGDSDYESSLLW